MFQRPDQTARNLLWRHLLLSRKQGRQRPSLAISISHHEDLGEKWVAVPVGHINMECSLTARSLGSPEGKEEEQADEPDVLYF